MKRQLAIIDKSEMVPLKNKEIDNKRRQRQLLSSIGMRYGYDSSYNSQETYSDYLEKISKGKLTLYKTYDQYDLEQGQAILMILDNKEIPSDMLYRLVETTKQLKILEENDKQRR